MKKFVFSAVAVIAFAGGAFASNDGNGDNPTLPVQTHLDYKAIAEIITDPYDCYWHVAVYNKEKEYVIGKPVLSHWVSSEEDCLEEISKQIKAYQVTYPVSEGFVVENVQEY